MVYMGTNFFLTTPNGSTGTDVHVGKRSGGWAFTFNAATVCDTEVRTRQEWERLVAMVGTGLFDEFGRRLTADEFWAEVDATTGKQSLRAHLEADDDLWARRLVERGDVWTDAEGWDFHRGDWC